jgi:hypothetical protein
VTGGHDPRVLDHVFAHHPPDPETARMHQRVRTGCRRLADLFAEVIPPGSELDHVQQKLRETMMAANAAVAVEHARDSTG